MKKIVLIIASLCFAVYAATPSAPTTYGPVTWECQLSNNISGTGNTQNLSSKGTGKDTIVGADTIRLVNNYKLEPGYIYQLHLTDSCAAADTIKFMQYVYGSDGTTLMATTSVDSLVGTNDAGETHIQLTAGQTVFGTRLTVYAVGWIATLKCLIKRCELYRIKSTLAK